MSVKQIFDNRRRYLRKWGRPVVSNQTVTTDTAPVMSEQERAKLDSMIMDIAVTDSKTDPTKANIKFLAISGGCGPEFDLDKGLLRSLHQRIEEYLIAEDKKLQSQGQ